MPQPFSLYIHIPYCLRKCPYCDFNSYAERIPEPSYIAALTKELSFYLERPEWQGRYCCSIFFGGGTPSLLSEQALHTLMYELQERIPLEDKVEISLEANPASITEQLGFAKLQAFYAAGVNRISLGVQSFFDPKLAFLGRIHSARDALDSICWIRKAGFDNLSLDLMFAAQGEMLSDWQDDIDCALKQSPEHLSLYALSVEQSTAFFELQKKGQLILPADEIQAEMYLTASKILQENGFLHYEISNFSLPGRQCQHNIGYWTRRDYLGLGAGAHSFCAANKNATSSFGMRWSNISKPADYIQQVLSTGSACAEQETLSLETARLEFFFLGLRRKEGVVFTEYQTLFGENVQERFAEQISQLQEQDLLESNSERLWLSDKGFLFADSVFEALG